MVEITQRQAKKTITEIGQSDTLLEGRANAYSVDIETKIQTQIDRLRDGLLKAEQGRETKVRA